MFSVVIPLYNKEKNIADTIQSVLNQSFQDFEIIVVNDGSTDNSISIVEAIKDERIRIINQENQGVSSARNKGIKEAKYKWITFLDADDLWMENHLQEALEMMKMFPKGKVFTTSFEFSDGRKMFRHKREAQIFMVEDYFKEILQEQLICTDTIVVHKTCFDKVGGFNPKLSRGEDLEMWARLAKNYTIIKSETITVVHNIDVDGNLTGSKSDLKKSILSIINLKGLTGAERKYFKQMLLRRIRSSLKDLSFKEVFILLAKHNVELLK